MYDEHGGTKHTLSSGFKTEEEAEKFAESENWSYVDENEFERHLEVEEVSPKVKLQSFSRSTEEVQALYPYFYNVDFLNYFP